jgi:hypothetical protein
VPLQSETERIGIEVDTTNPATVLVATRGGGNGPWTYIKPTLSDDRRHVVVTTNHFSWWDVVQLTKAAFAEVKKAVLDGLTSNVYVEAEKPRCQNESGARQDGYTIESSAKDTVYWCLGLEDGRRVLHVVNRTRYPLNVLHPGMTVVRNGHVTLELSQLARVGFSNIMLLYPRDEALLAVADLKAGKVARLSTDFSGYANSLYQLEFGVQALASIVTRFGAGSGLIHNGAIIAGQLDRVMDIVDKLLTAKACSNAVLGPLLQKKVPSFGAVFANCLNPARIAEYLGDGLFGVALAAIVAAGPFVAFVQSQLNALFDLVTRRTQYTILVRRVSLFARYVGNWTRHVTQLTVRPNLTGHLEAGLGFDPSGGPGAYCTAVSDLALKLNTDGSVSGRYVNPHFERMTEDGLGSPATCFDDQSIDKVFDPSGFRWTYKPYPLILENSAVDSGYQLGYCKPETPSSQSGPCGA